MSLSDLTSYSSLNSHSPPNDDDKWVSDDPATIIKKPKPDNPAKDDELESMPKLPQETKMESSSSRRSDKSAKSSQSHKSTKPKKSVPQADTSESSQPIESDESSSQSSSKKSAHSSEKLPKKKGNGYSPQIQISLSGSKLAFANGVWQDVSEIGELVDKVHPIVQESISLKKRAELLVRLIAESEYESQLIQNEMNECDEVIKSLRKVLGEDDSTSQTATEEDDDDD